LKDRDGEADSVDPAIIVLAPVRSPGAVIDFLRDTQTCSFDYLVEGDGGKVTEAILACATTLEPHLPSLTPEVNWETQRGGHPEISRLKTKLALESEIAASLRVLKDARLGLFLGRYTVRMKVPWYDADEGVWVISAKQQPKDVRVAVLRIDQTGQDNLMVNLPCGEEVIKWTTM